jgi:mRNA-degrading endonuclease RelE of RelBE toxin-antitoxin system
MILDAIKSHLPFEPLGETTNSKPLRPNPFPDWELRIGQFRVSYEVDEASARVTVIAVGYKDRNKLFIGGHEFEL